MSMSSDEYGVYTYTYTTERTVPAGVLVGLIIAGVVGLVVVIVLIYRCCVPRRTRGRVIAAPPPQAAPSPPSASVIPYAVLGGAEHYPTATQYQPQPTHVGYPPPYDHGAVKKEPMLMEF